MKTESPVLAGPSETTYHEEIDRADIDLEFSFWFSVAVLTYLFTSFVSTFAFLL